MPFIFAYGLLNNRDKRPQDTSVSSDKFFFFFPKGEVMRYFRHFKSSALSLLQN